MLSVKSVYQYPDTQTGDEDAFAREPFIVWFSSPKTGEKRETYLHKNDEMMTMFSSVFHQKSRTSSLFPFTRLQKRR